MSDKTEPNEDNFSTPDYWILIGLEGVTITKQEDGHPADWMQTIPKKDFEKLIEWYNRTQKP